MDEIKIFESINSKILESLGYKNINSAQNLIKNFSNEKIKSYEKINMKLKEENRLKNSTLEMKLRKRQKSILN